MQPVAVWVTATDVEEAEKLAGDLVEKRLAACANVIPKIFSAYWWDGKVEESEEALIILKTTKDKTDDIVAYVNEHHSYDVPAVSVLEITGGNPAYLEWIGREVEK
ncbi:MAG: divalent-cation tolerance protein CutA [Peptococcaceae bacterium]|nr:divalent-cation tolerance protein CutA [Peptococcaceae bacterium]